MPIDYIKCSGDYSGLTKGRIYKVENLANSGWT